MIRALRDYIIDQNKETLESAMAQLKKSLDFDSTAIDHLHLALYSFQVSAAARISILLQSETIFLLFIPINTGRCYISITIS